MSTILGGIGVLALYLAPLLAVVWLICFLADNVLPRCHRFCAWLKRACDIDLDWQYEDD